MLPGEPGPESLPSFRQRFRRVMRRLNLTDTDDLYDLTVTPTQLRHRLQLAQLELEMHKDELRRTQAQLARSRARFVDLLDYTHVLYNLAPVAYLTLLMDGIVVEANQTALALLDTSRAALLQHSLTDFVAEADQAAFQKFRNRLLATQRSQRGELKLRRRDGSIVVVQVDATVTKSLLSDDAREDRPRGGVYLRLTLSDVSVRAQLEEEERKARAQLEATLHELRQAQDKLVRQERLAVVGQLAAGVAHDFNNIVASITLYTQLVMRTPELPAAVHKRMEAILTQSNRAATLVQQILDFSRRTVPVRQPTPLTAYLQRVTEMLQQTLPDTIQVSFDHSTILPGIDDMAEIDHGRIEQALLNLALNARDAMPEGGTLQITLTRVTVEESAEMAAEDALAPGEWLKIDFSDTGVGIAPENMPNIFEPFFTTKGVGLGSGLGLSQVWGLVKQHQGEIHVASEFGRGTTFSIYLPSSTEAHTVPVEPEPTAIPHGQGEMVLVVEDSDFLRAAILSVMAQLGYQTLAARNGQEAFDLVIQEQDKIQLILSDLSMPLMGGQELVRAIRMQGWQQPVVILSGQPLSEAEIVHLESYGQVSRLQKPIVMERLARALYQALHNQAT